MKGGPSIARVIKYKSPALAAANHYTEDERGRSYNDLWNDEDYNYTYRRKLIIAKKMAKLKINKLTDSFKLLRYDPVFNYYTAQSMVFCIQTGEALIRTY